MVRKVPGVKWPLVKPQRRGGREAGVGAGTGEEQARGRGVEVEEKEWLDDSRRIYPF